MYVAIWKFRVREGAADALRTLNNPGGAWPTLFSRDSNYLGTEVLSSTSDEREFVTIDRWTSREAYDAFRRQWADEYAAIDRAAEGLTEAEELIGTFESIPALP
jgi:heme-degrading monooxygenase HmoA